MPGYGVSKATYRISLKGFNGSDDWVDIKAGRSSGASARVQFAGFRITGVTAAGEPVVNVAEDPLLRIRMALFRESIVAWSLKADEADEAPLPLTEETFAEVLDGDVATWLDTQITQYYANRRFSEDTMGESPTPTTPP